MPSSFFYLFGLSLLGVLLSSRLQHMEGILQYSGLVAGLVPLIIYHFGLSKARLLTPTKIDSVYYFGFLVTVITLVSTAISLGLAKGIPDLRWILLQFGLGLVATGYALFARLQLLAKSTATAETDVVDSTEKLAKSVERVAQEFDKAGYQVAAFTERTEERLTAVEAKFEERLNKAQLAFDSAMAKTAEMSYMKTVKVIDDAAKKFGEGISAVMEEVIRIQSEAEAISFTKATQRIEGFSTEIENAIKSITVKVAEAGKGSAEAITELTATSRKVSKLATDLSSSLEKLGELDSLLKSIASLSTSLGDIGKTAAEADAAISSFATKTSLAEDGLRTGVIDPLSTGGFARALYATENSLSAIGQKAAESLQSMEKAANVFEESLKNTTASLTSSHSTATRVAAFEAEISSATERLSNAISSLSQQSSSMAGMIGFSSEELTKAISAASSSLNSIHDRLVALDDLASAARLATRQIESTYGQQESTNAM